jgi:hypothetical protein
LAERGGKLSIEVRNKARNIIKSRIGEGIVEAMLLEARNEVRRFGQEWRTAGFSELAREAFRFIPLTPRQKIKPDFMVINRERKIEGVEVKFMSTDLFRWCIQEEYRNKLRRFWPGTRIFMVSCEMEPHIRVLDPPYHNGEEPFEGRAIYDVPEFGVGRDLYDRYARIIEGLPVDLLKNEWAGAK